MELQLNNYYVKYTSSKYWSDNWKIYKVKYARVLRMVIEEL